MDMTEAIATELERIEADPSLQDLFQLVEAMRAQWLVIDEFVPVDIQFGLDQEVLAILRGKENGTRKKEEPMRQIEELRKAIRLLHQIAYPRRGTVEESQTLQDFADLIQREWSAERLGELAGDTESQNLIPRMQAIGKAVEAELPRGFGFFVLCFAFNEPDANAQYVSNASRKDVVEAMQDFIKRNPMQEPGRN
jgi:glutathione S-transferase